MEPKDCERFGISDRPTNNIISAGNFVLIPIAKPQPSRPIPEMPASVGNKRGRTRKKAQAQTPPTDKALKSEDGATQLDHSEECVVEDIRILCEGDSEANGKEAAAAATSPSPGTDSRYMHCAVEYGATAADICGPSKKFGNIAGFKPVEVFVTKNLELLEADVISFCIHCRELNERWQYHTASRHTDRMQVAGILKERNYAKRKALWSWLQNKCNHIHNVEVLRKGEGVLIVCRTQYVPPANCYMQCLRCYGYYGKADLKTHKCPWKVVADPKLRAPTTFERYDEEYLEKLPIKLGVVIRKTVREDVKEILKNDDTVREFGFQMLMDCGAKGGCPCKTKHCPYVMRKLELLADFLLRARKRARIDDLTMAQALMPKRLKAVMAAAKEVTAEEKDFRELLFGLNACVRICKQKCFNRKKRGPALFDAANYDKFLEICIPEAMDWP